MAVPEAVGSSQFLAMRRITAGLRCILKRIMPDLDQAAHADTALCQPGTTARGTGEHLGRPVFVGRDFIRIADGRMAVRRSQFDFARDREAAEALKTPAAIYEAAGPSWADTAKRARKIPTEIQ